MYETNKDDKEHYQHHQQGLCPNHGTDSMDRALKQHTEDRRYEEDVNKRIRDYFLSNRNKVKS